MKGKELLEALSSLSDAQLEFDVATEGCDCNGDVAEVQVYANEHEIYLTRSTEPQFIGPLEKPYDWDEWQDLLERNLLPEGTEYEYDQRWRRTSR